ncbi:MAG: hypothetical protein J0H14_03185 [Alphaproteobacteria bacterium]|nr:hypothetical protein [Alphaproteobacteria bacterium]
MARILIATLILAAAAAPAFACDYNKSAAATPQSKAATAQPANGHAPSGAISSQRPS